MHAQITLDAANLSIDDAIAAMPGITDAAVLTAMEAPIRARCKAGADVSGWARYRQARTDRITELSGVEWKEFAPWAR